VFGHYCASGSGSGLPGPLVRSSRRGRALTTVGILVAISLMAAGCGLSGPSPKPQVTQLPIRLGLLLPLSGDSRTTGEAMRVASQMAVDRENANGGVHGRRIELITLDDACDPQTAVIAANKLVASRVAVSVGGYCSSATLPTLPILRTAGIPMILPAANSQDLLQPGYDSVFLLNGTGSREAVVALTWMRQLGAHRVALVDDGTSYSANITDVAAERLKVGAGPTGLSLRLRLRITQGAKQFTAAAASVRSSGSDVVYFTGYTAEAGRLTRDLRETGYRGLIMVADGCADAALSTFAEGRAEGVYATTPPLAQDLPLPSWWTAEYQRRAGAAPGPYTVQAYDSVTIAVDALRRLPPDSDGPTIARAIAATKGLRLLFGMGAFDPDHTLSGFAFTLRRVRSGRFVLVRTGNRRVGTKPAGA
jgi:branched-chain amino acid transport system substrate-binding protein